MNNELKVRTLKSLVEFCPSEPDDEFIAKTTKRVFLWPNDGHFSEMFVNEIGKFVGAASLDKYSVTDGAAGSFTLKLPKIPINILHQTVSLFNRFMRNSNSSSLTLEAFVQIFWDRTKKEYFIFVPQQVVSTASVRYINDQRMLQEHLLVMDIHSHNNMSAFFSSIDDRDEKENRFFGVIGKMSDEWPQASFRMAVNGRYYYIDMADLFDMGELKSHPGDDGKNLLVGINKNLQVPSRWISAIKTNDDEIRAKIAQLVNKINSEQQQKNKQQPKPKRHHDPRQTSIVWDENEYLNYPSESGGVEIETYADGMFDTALMFNLEEDEETISQFLELLTEDVRIIFYEKLREQYSFLDALDEGDEDLDPKRG